MPGSNTRDDLFSRGFLGIHFDFHARDEDLGVGRNTTAAAVHRVIDAIGPDYIETDCKGHHGLSSYPTRVGNAAPGIVGDPLRIWRDVTRQRGVALYVHYSGMFDTKAVQLHPEWARIDENGVADPNITSLFSPYVDDLMIPQLKELIDDYQIDGVWVDGDCWATAVDYSPTALTAFSDATGITETPKGPQDSFWLEFCSFHRAAFLSYVRHYTDALHLQAPCLRIGSAWLFSSFVPEPVSVGVDYLSGDSSAINHSYARMEGRFFVGQHTPWDLMTWSFAGRFGLDGPPPAIALKSAIQLEQEAATIISLGGGYQTVSNQKLDGTVIEWQLPILGEVAAFCRERQQFCHNTEPLPQIALLHSATSYYQRAGKLMNSIDALDPLLGTLEALLDRQNCVDIVMEHQLLGRSADFPLIVVPEWHDIAAELRAELHHYVHSGGKLLVIGALAVRQFSDLLRIDIVGDPTHDRNFWIEHDDQLAGHQGAVQKVALWPDTQPLSQLHWENDYTAGQTAASIAATGAGAAAGIYFDFGAYHHSAVTTVAKDLLQDVVRRLVPEPLITLSGSHLVDLIARQSDNTILIHLINTAGQQRDLTTYVYDEIPPLGPLTLTITLDHPPRSTTLEPGHLQPPTRYADGKHHITIDELQIHTTVRIILRRVPPPVNPSRSSASSDDQVKA